MKSVKNRVLDANKFIVEKKLVSLTWGNVSEKQESRIFIKPSGVNLGSIRQKDVSEVDMQGNHIAGLKPSVDTPAHLSIYNSFPTVNSVVHTHSKYATIFAQLCKPIRCLGTTHADYFRGVVPVVPIPEWDESVSYEKVTGEAIASYFIENNIDYLEMPVTLVEKHGVFAWGESIEKAVENAYVLELVAEMAYFTLVADSSSQALEKEILDKHFLRKNGNGKYYGQG